jgi:hypothetical protein
MKNRCDGNEPLLDGFPRYVRSGTIVCGTAFVFSGLMFLLPGRRSTGERAFKESVSEIDSHLDRMRRDQRYLPPR